MSPFAVRIEAEGCRVTIRRGLFGLPIRVRRSEEILGCYATRVVEALTPELAGDRATNIVLEELSRLVRTRTDGVRIRAVSVEPLARNHVPGCCISAAWLHL